MPKNLTVFLKLQNDRLLPITDFSSMIFFFVLFPTAGQYLFQAPNHYIFHGAEVYSDSEDETSSSCGSESEESECSADGVEEDSEPEEADALAAEAVDGETCLRDTIQHTVAAEAASSVQTDSSPEKTQSTTHL